MAKGKRHFLLSRQLIILIIISMTVTVLPGLFIISSFIYKTIRTNAIQSATVLSEKYGAIAASILKEPLNAAHLLASNISALESVEPYTRRKALHDLVEKSLKGDNPFFSMWVCYEPNQFDGFDAVYADTRWHDSSGRVVLYFDKNPVTQTITEDMLTDYTDADWYLNSLTTGKDCQFDPYMSLISTGEDILVTTFTVPLKNQDGKTVGVFGIDLTLSDLSEELNTLKLYETGYGSLLSPNGVIVTEKDESLIGTEKEDFESIVRPLKRTAADKSVADSNVSQKNENGKEIFEVLVPITVAEELEPWYLLCKVSQKEVYKEINQVILIAILVFLLCFALIIATLSFIVVRKLRPLTHIATALRDIAQGDGDLTVKLPIIGNDEIADLSRYFNETIAKIASSVRLVGDSANTMQEIGNHLSTNMTETASSINQISANIEGVKHQTLTQASSVTETAATMEEIIRTIKNLNGSIESQAASVAQSSSSIEEMVANITSITQNLNKADETVNHLASATDDGRETVAGAGGSMQKIAEESGALIEASAVIQNIASQTNLLAMNAAIEAAHAGDAGKGFAVVADEIRKLAEESSSQGKTITGTLKNLSAEIQEVANSAKLVGDKFNIIYDLSEEVKKTSALLTQAMQEQENGSREILSAIKSINSVTLEVRDGSLEMLKGGEQVAKEMKKLDDLTRVITDSMNEMASGAVQIDKAIQEVTEITQRNKQAIDSLNTEVGKFKV